METKKITVLDIIHKKKAREKITALTAYDYPTARILDEAGIDIILVGDSVGNVVLGYGNTLPVTMDELIHHTKAVHRGLQKAFLVFDMPFLSFNLSLEQTLANAGRAVQSAGAEAVKVEGASPDVLKAIEKIIDIGVPVMGHIGLTPQSVHRLGGFRKQGTKASDAKKILQSAKALEKAGVFSIVLEFIPSELAKKITESVHIPTIGIGAGPFCDGQILVVHDMVGLTFGTFPKFAKRYADLGSELKKAVSTYISEVKGGKFPQ